MSGTKSQWITSMLVVFLATLTGFESANAQIAIGGNYKLDQAVLANGGGVSTGTGYSVHGTSGQSAAGGNLNGSLYNLKSGFWYPLLPPTAANVEISGRVLREDGLGIGNVKVTLEGGTLTSSRVTLTSSFGYFRFDEIETGQIYVISISSKRYGFPNPSQTILVFNNVTDIVFQAVWQNWIKPVGIEDAETLNMN